MARRILTSDLLDALLNDPRITPADQITIDLLIETGEWEIRPSVTSASMPAVTSQSG